MDRHLICFLFPDSPSDSGVDLEHVSKFDTMFMYYPLKHKVPAFHKGTSTGGRIRPFQYMRTGPRQGPGPYLTGACTVFLANKMIKQHFV